MEPASDAGQLGAACKFRDRQRVLVRWRKKPRLGDHTDTYSARICQIRTEFAGGRGLVQMEMLCVYEAGGQRLWHTPSELSPLDESAPVAGTAGADDDDVCEIIESRWRQHSLKCCYSHARLTDPARCASCLHPSSLNYDALLTCMSSTRACPVVGCTVRHARDIVRDDALRTALADLPADAETCWLLGDAEVRLHPPEGVLGDSSSTAGASSTASAAFSGESARRAKLEDGKEEPEVAEEAEVEEVEARLATEARGVRLLLSNKSATGYKGVARNPAGRYQARYLASSGGMGKNVWIGTFDTAMEAALAYAQHLQTLGTTEECGAEAEAAVETEVGEEQLLSKHPAYIDLVRCVRGSS